MEERRQKQLGRGTPVSLEKGHLYPLREARVSDLAAYLREVLQRPEAAEPAHEVVLEEIRLEDQIAYLERILSRRSEPARFQELIHRPWWRLEWIVTFLAMLELMRTGRIAVLQEEPFGEILLMAATPSEDGWS